MRGVAYVENPSVTASPIIFRCLDACIREKNVDVKRSRELQGFLDAIRRGQEQVLGDLSMTLCDPFAINFLATSAMRIMNLQVNFNDTQN